MKWILSKDQLPEENQYIAAIRLTYPSFYWIGHYTKHTQFEITDHFTFWIPLPELPKTKKKKEEKPKISKRKEESCADIQFKDYFLCEDCAKKEGAVWPYGHIATFHEAVCVCCVQKNSLCAASDWTWPGNTKASTLMREI